MDNCNFWTPPKNQALGTQGCQNIYITGRQGNQGPEGPTGKDGVGFPGPPGPPGAPGVGRQGSQGPAGGGEGSGTQGFQGLVGGSGAQGIQGVQGVQGSPGAGTSGTQGSQGRQGPIGPDVYVSPSTREFHVGNNAPYATIQAAVDAINALSPAPDWNNRCTIILHEGYYVLTSPITVPALTCVQGINKDTVTLYNNSTDMFVAGGDDVYLRDFLVEGSGSTGAVFNCNGRSRLHVRDVDMLGGGGACTQPFLIQSGSSWRTLFIERCVLNSAKTSGYVVQFTNTSGTCRYVDVEINDVFSDTYSMASTGGSFSISGCQDFRFRNCKIRGVPVITRCIYLTRGSNAGTAWIEVFTTEFRKLDDSSGTAVYSEANTNVLLACCDFLSYIALGSITVVGSGSGTQGRQGNQGNQGLQGNQGQQGAQGLQGLQGFGYQGYQGLQGAGTQGLQGTNPGPMGPQGAQGVGAQGPQGVVGTQGPQGLQGAGVQGLQGTNPGPAGPQGPQGVNGYMGVDGPQGNQGLQGTNPGPVGPQGLQGANGVNGVQGYQGNGIQGFQGSGSQGPQGVGGTNGVQGYQGSGVQGFQGSGGQGLQGPQGSASTATGSVVLSTFAKPASVALDSVGTLDWFAWGNSTSEPSTTYWSVRKLLGGKKINISWIATGTKFTQTPDMTVTWTAADALSNASGSTTYRSGVYGVLGSGFAITVPANRSTSVLRLYMSAYNSRVKIVARLSDGSIADVVDTSNDISGFANLGLMFTYNSSVDGQFLHLSVTFDVDHGLGNLMMAAAALSTS